MAGISERVGGMAETSSEIAGVAEESSASAEEMSSATQETSSQSQELSASLAGLGAAADRLLEASRQFNVSGLARQNSPASAFAACDARWNSGEGKIPKKTVAAAKPTATRMSSG